VHIQGRPPSSPGITGHRVLYFCLYPQPCLCPLQAEDSADGSYKCCLESSPLVYCKPGNIAVPDAEWLQVLRVQVEGDASVHFSMQSFDMLLPWQEGAETRGNTSIEEAWGGTLVVNGGLLWRGWSMANTVVF
jgi:hypothetical protein